MLALFKNDWIPFVCGTDVSLEITATKVPIRTRGDGHWKKYTYQDIAFVITLSGLLTFDEDNWTGWDMLDNMFNFSHVLARVSFTDVETGDIKTVQGYVMIETSTLSYSPGNLVKDDFQLQGNGKMDMFDGLIPCDSAITDITITGQTDADGIIHSDYTFSGPVYQIKYRIDDQGDYIYATAGPTINVAGLPNGNHTIEIITVCQNGYEGEGREERFQVTHAQICSSTIDTITVDTDAFTITNTHSGPATQMRYRIDGGVWIDALITATISISGLDPGDHTVEIVPVCANGVEGSGMTNDFTIVSQPAMSMISWSFITVGNYNTLSIYVAGVLIAIANTNGTGSITAAVGSNVRSVAFGPSGHGAFRHVQLRVRNLTLGTILFDHTGTANLITQITQDFTFPADGDEYLIEGIITIPS